MWESLKEYRRRRNTRAILAFMVFINLIYACSSGPLWWFNLSSACYALHTLVKYYW